MDISTSINSITIQMTAMRLHQQPSREFQSHLEIMVCASDKMFDWFALIDHFYNFIFHESPCFLSISKNAKQVDILQKL